MGLFCGKICQCKRRAKSWFAGMPDLTDAAIAACKDNKGLSREEFLCSGKYVDQRNVILKFGFDPCLGDDIDFGDTIAGQAAGEDDQQWERLKPIVYGLSLLIAAAVAVFFIRKLK